MCYLLAGERKRGNRRKYGERTPEKKERMKEKSWRNERIKGVCGEFLMDSDYFDVWGKEYNIIKKNGAQRICLMKV